MLFNVPLEYHFGSLKKDENQSRAVHSELCILK